MGANNLGLKALDMLDLDRPTLHWCCLAKGMGILASKP